jgi:uncharacterized protein YabE (DUF348 family)/lipoprotein-anchoring transpeptidase ErfK/SrfK
VLHTRTWAREVGGVLDRLEVRLAAADRVEPARNARVTDGLVVLVTRAKTVEVEVEGREVQEVVAVVDTVADVLHAAGLAHHLEDDARLTPPADHPVADGDRIVVELPTTVLVTVDGEEHRLESFAATVADVLRGAGVDLGEQDLVDPPLDREAAAGIHIVVQRVRTLEEEVDVAIPHGTRRTDSEQLPRGETRVEREGRDGLVREHYLVTLVDGDESERELVREEIVREPVERVVLVGIGPSPLREAQRLLADLGYPVGPADGVDGDQTRRGLCAWRRLEGHGASRQGLQPGELEALRSTSGLPAAGAAGRGVTVDTTCQALYYRQDGRWRRVHPVSTGADGLPQAGEYVIQRTRPGWHTSTLYPATQPNMYNSLYFHGAIAIHGSHHVPAHPASAGCVRVTPGAADQLFADLRIGDPVRVIGAW